jgi:GAF domain-containing protein
MFDLSCVFVLPIASIATPTLSSVSFEYSASVTRDYVDPLESALELARQAEVASVGELLGSEEPEEVCLDAFEAAESERVRVSFLDEHDVEQVGAVRLVHDHVLHPA